MGDTLETFAICPVALKKSEESLGNFVAPNNPRNKPKAPESSSVDEVRIYLEQIGKIPLLRKEQEVEFAKKIERGDENARRKFAEANLRLVVSIARKKVRATHDLTLLCLIQEGNIGLMTAVDRFDFRKGYKFSTYATWWITQAINRAIAKTGNTIRIPSHIWEITHKAYRYREDRKEQFQPTPTDQDMCQHLEITEQTWKQVARVLESKSWTISLDRPSNDSEDLFFEDLVYDESSVLEDKGIESIDALQKKFQKRLTRINLRSRIVLGLRFGLVEILDEQIPIISILNQIRRRSTKEMTIRSDDPFFSADLERFLGGGRYTTVRKMFHAFGFETTRSDAHLTSLKSCGYFLGLSRERVRQIEVEAMNKLAVMKNLKQYLELFKSSQQLHDFAHENLPHNMHLN